MAVQAPNGVDIIPLLDPEHDPGNTEHHSASANMGEKMKAVHYEGPFKVSVREVETPQIQHPDDAIIKVTTAGTYLSLSLSLSQKHVRESRIRLMRYSDMRVGSAHVPGANSCGSGPGVWAREHGGHY
jgi:hypothetical protein